jgi:DNA invertase Pin-like site-specific DNA recombinase
MPPEVDPFHLLMATSGSLAKEIVQSISDLGRDIWSQRVKKGMARAKATGKRFGRPPKDLTAVELSLIENLRTKGVSWRNCAIAVSEARGALKIVDLDSKRRATVSHSHVRRQFKARKS